MVYSNRQEPNSFKSVVKIAKSNWNFTDQIDEKFKLLLRKELSTLREDT